MRVYGISWLGLGRLPSLPGVRRLLVTLLALLACLSLAMAAGGAPPVARIAGPKTTTDTTPTFRLSATGKHGGFRCSVDGGAFRVCRSPWTPRLAVGAHVLRVRTVDKRGRAGRATTFRVSIVAAGPQARKAVQAGSAPWGVLLANDSLWVASFFDDVVLRLDPATGASRARIPLGGAGTSLAATDGQVWAADFDGNRIVRVDTGAVSSPIAVGPGPEDLVAGLGALWTANKGCTDPSNPCAGNGSVSRVDPATGAVKTIALGKEPRYVTTGASSVWATSFFSDTLSRIDPVTGNVTNTVAAPRWPGRHRRGVRLGLGRGLRERRGVAVRPRDARGDREDLRRRPGHRGPEGERRRDLDGQQRRREHLAHRPVDEQGRPHRRGRRRPAADRDRRHLPVGQQPRRGTVQRVDY